MNLLHIFSPTTIEPPKRQVHTHTPRVPIAMTFRSQEQRLLHWRGARRCQSQACRGPDTGAWPLSLGAGGRHCSLSMPPLHRAAPYQVSGHRHVRGSPQLSSCVWTAVWYCLFWGVESQDPLGPGNSKLPWPHILS